MQRFRLKQVWLSAIMSKAYWMFKYAGEYQIKILTVWGDSILLTTVRRNSKTWKYIYCHLLLSFKLNRNVWDRFWPKKLLMSRLCKFVTWCIKESFESVYTLWYSAHRILLYIPFIHFHARFPSGSQSTTISNTSVGSPQDGTKQVRRCSYSTSVAYLKYSRHGSCHGRHFDEGAKIAWQKSQFVTCSFIDTPPESLH